MDEHNIKGRCEECGVQVQPVEPVRVEAFKVWHQSCYQENNK